MSRFAALAVALAVIGAPAPLPAELRPASAGPQAATTPSIQIQVVEPGGFHWDDAAVGSLAGVGLVLVVGGLTFAARRE